jgi:hypothetical protein
MVKLVEGSLLRLHLKSCWCGVWLVEGMCWQSDASFGFSDFRAMTNWLRDLDGNSMVFYAVLQSMPSFLCKPRQSQTFCGNLWSLVCSYRDLWESRCYYGIYGGAIFYGPKNGFCWCIPTDIHGWSTSHAFVYIFIILGKICHTHIFWTIRRIDVSCICYCIFIICGNKSGACIWLLSILPFMDMQNVGLAQIICSHCIFYGKFYICGRICLHHILIKVF